MNENAGKIQASELEIMRVLWNAGGTLPLIEIRRILSESTSWEESTIKTLLRRLCVKGVVKLERRGIYSAIVTEKEYRDWSTHNFIDRLYHGSAKQLIASLVSGGTLNKEDIDELKAMFKVRDENE